MRKEVPNNAPLGEFLKGDVEDWKSKWQDRNFTNTFPTSAQNFLSQDGHTQFLKEHGGELIHSAVSTFMALPWNPREEGHIAVIGMGFTENGEVMNLKTKELTSNNKPTIDSLMRAEIASLLLLGFGPSSKEYTKDFIVKSYIDLTTNRRDIFRNTTFRFITKDNIVRKWVKSKNLDMQNGFSWDKEVTNLALSLPPPRFKNTNGMLRALPNELQNLELFVPEAVEAAVDYVLDYVRNLDKIGRHRKDLQVFIAHVQNRQDVNCKEKLGLLKELSRPR
jgi:hypothetical protein